MITDNRGNIYKTLLIYTGLFALFVLCIFAVLIVEHNTFVQYHDAYRQGVFRLIELRNQIESILSGEGFSFWSWYEGTGLDEPLEIFVDPCSFFACFFPIRYIELGFTVAALLRMYLGGLSFLLLGREVGLARNQAILGSIMYIFSACFIGLALRQSDTLVNAYLFPILVVAVERIYKGKSPLPFIFTIAYYMLISTYYSFMSAIIIIIYILIRYFAYSEGFDAKDYFTRIGWFIGYGIVGIMISAVGSLFSYYTVIRASTDSSMSSQGLLFDGEFYASFGKMILGRGATYDYLDMGLPVIIIMLLPVAIRLCDRKSTSTIMTCILLVMMLIPFFGSMLNGFGYVSFRWSYTFTLFATWCAVQHFSIETFRDRKNTILSAGALALITIWTLVFYKLGITDINRTGEVFVPLQIAAGAALLLLIIVLGRKERIGRPAMAAFFLIPLISLSVGWSVGFMNNIENFTKNASVYKQLNKSTLRVSNRIEDDGFFRVDSVDGMRRHANLNFPVNESIWWKSNNIFIYNSMIPRTLTDFNVETGNSYGYARRVYMLSNENRMGLDFLYGVRYFLGNDSKKAGYGPSDNYAGYGFEKYARIDGVNVYKNKYDVELGFVLEKAMKKSEYDRLGRLEKEQALLQAAVIPDEQMDKCSGVPVIEADELDLDIKEVPFKVSSVDGLTMEDGRIVTHKKGASFTVSLDAPKGQLMVSFDSLIRDAHKSSEGRSYEITAEDGKVVRSAINQISRQGVKDLKNHDLNMGYVEGPREIKISFSGKGTYTYDRLYISTMSTDNYDKYARENVERKLKVADYSQKDVEGTVDAGKGGILFLSIPAFDNWDIYVDGKKVERIDHLDTTFAGAVVSEGEHNIQLVYNNRYITYGGIVSGIGLLIVVGWLVFKRRRKLQ